MAAFLGLLLFAQGWRKLLLLATIITLVVAFSPIGERYRQALQSGDGGNLYRERAAVVALAMVQDSPVFGFGRGSYMFVHEHFKQPGDMRKPNAHNVLLNMAAELGLVGVFAYGWLNVALFRSLWRRQRELAHNPFEQAFVRGVWLASIAYVVTGLFIFNWGYLMASSLWWLLLGLAACVSGAPTEIPNGP